MNEREALHAAIVKICQAWTALQLAITQGFCGRDSAERGAWMPGALTDWVLQNKRNLDQSDIEECLFDMMTGDFECLTEDGSCREVSDLIWKILRSIQTANFEEYSRLMDGIKVPKENLQRSQVELKNSDTEGSEDEDDNDDDERVEAKVEKVREKQEPIIDEDGFEMVATKQKGGRKSKKLEAQIQAQMDLIHDTNSTQQNDGMDD